MRFGLVQPLLEERGLRWQAVLVSETFLFGDRQMGQKLGRGLTPCRSRRKRARAISLKFAVELRLAQKYRLS